MDNSKIAFLVFLVLLFLTPIVVIGEMFVTKLMNPCTWNKLLSEKTISGVLVSDKRVRKVDDSISTAWFVINPAMWLAMKASERHYSEYIVDISINGELHSLTVTKDQYEKIDPSKKLTIKEYNYREFYKLCLFEMMLLGDFQRVKEGDSRKFSPIV